MLSSQNSTVQTMAGARVPAQYTKYNKMSTVVIGIDPGARNNGYAYRIDAGPIVAGSVKDIVQISSIAALSELADAGHDLCAVIECPKWSGAGTREVRMAAIQWERHLQRLFDRRPRSITFVDPRAWQALILGGCPGSDTKERSIFYARRMALVEVASDHEADAVCLCMYAGLRLNGLVNNEQERASSNKHRRSRK